MPANDATWPPTQAAPGSSVEADQTAEGSAPGSGRSLEPRVSHAQAENPDGPRKVVAAAPQGGAAAATTKLFRTAIKVVAAAPQGGAAAATTKLFRTAAEIAEAIAAVIRWIAKPWIAAGTIVEIVGKAKSAGKTTLISHLIAAILDGKPFLGEPTLKSAVVWLTEQNDTSFREVLRRAGLLGRKDLVILSHYLVAGRTWRDIAKLTVNEAKRIGAKVIFIDTLGPFAGLIGDAENRAGDAEAAVRAISELACPLGIAVVLVRHERKAGGDVGDAGRGSSAFVGTVDVHISLRELDDPPRSTFRVIMTLGRFDETPAELVIELTTNGYVPHGTIDEMKATVPQQMILEVLPTDPKDALTLEEILRKSGLKRTRAQDLLKELAESGDVVRVGSGGRGDPYRYHRPEAASPDGGDAPDTSSATEEQGDSPIPGSADEPTDHQPGVADFSDFPDALIDPEELAPKDDPRWHHVRDALKLVCERYEAGSSLTTNEACEYLGKERGIQGRWEQYQVVLLGELVCWRRVTKRLGDGTRVEMLEPLAKGR